MLRFEIQPDIVFLDMLEEAIEQMIDEMDLEEPTDQDESFELNMPRSSRVFTAQQAKDQLRTLQRPLHAAELYKPADYHWPLLYECLELYCEIFNDLRVGVISEK